MKSPKNAAGTTCEIAANGKDIGGKPRMEDLPMATDRTVTRRSTKKSRQRERLVLALLQQPSLEKAAASMGISAVTAWRISKTPEFQEEYRQARSEAVAQSLGRLQQGSGAAATVLLKIMLDPTNPATSRLHAADRVIQHSKNHLELEDFELRLRRLEQVATQLDPGGVRRA